MDLGKTALYIAAEDDSLISHSSVPLPVDAFIGRLDDLSMGYCSRYSSSFRSSPDSFLECLERYMYVDKVWNIVFIIFYFSFIRLKNLLKKSNDFFCFFILVL